MSDNRIFSEIIRRGNGSPPYWVNSDLRDGTEFVRRFYFEDGDNGQWIAVAKPEIVLVTGSSILWETLTFEEGGFRRWASFYLSNPNNQPDGYDTPGPSDRTVMKIQTEEACWIASVLGVAVELYTAWKYPKKEQTSENE